jgi:general secretion pathway protein C
MTPKTLFTIIHLICITAVAYLAVDGLYGIAVARLADKPMSVAPQVSRANDPDAAARPLSAYNSVLERNLFGTRATSDAETEAVDIASLEETKLDLKLWGTVSGSANGIYAVIEDVRAREQNLYRAGDAVQNATVKEIFREKVVLTVDGKDEILQMQDLASQGSMSRPGGVPVRTELPAGGMPRAQRISLRRSYIEQSMTDVASLMTQMQVRPHMEDGVPAGLALSSIKPNSIFRRMGLRNGDVITGVDGNELSSVDDALRLVEDLKSASSLSVQLKRRGQVKNIEYSIR